VKTKVTVWESVADLQEEIQSNLIIRRNALNPECLLKKAGSEKIQNTIRGL